MIEVLVFLAGVVVGVVVCFAACMGMAAMMEDAASATGNCEEVER